jgi:hypothetical protein
MIYDHVYHPLERLYPVPRSLRSTTCIHTSLKIATVHTLLKIATRRPTALHLAILLLSTRVEFADSAIEDYSLFRRGATVTVTTFPF